MHITDFFVFIAIVDPPLQNPHKCTCNDIMIKYTEEYQYTRDYYKSDKCHAGYHAGFGDVEGLRWHLYCDQNVHGTYNFSDMTDKLVLITAKFCKGESINDIFQCLKEYGANFNITTRITRQTAFHLLFYNITHLDRQHEVLFQAIKFLKEMGCDINEKDKYGKVVLSYYLEAIYLREGGAPIIEALLKNGADPNIPNNGERFDAKTALFLAVKLKWPLIVLELIVKYGVDVKAVNKEGMNVLAVATESRDHNIMDWMLDNINLDVDNITIAKKYAKKFSKEYQILKKKRSK